MVTGRTVTLAGATLIAFGTAAPALPDDYGSAAGSAGRYTAYAEVLQVSPRYGWHEVSEPVRQCVDVERYQPSPRYSLQHHDQRQRRRGHGGETAASLVGGLIGGLIGNQFGGGNGRTALTVAGAAIGASVARDHVRRVRDPYYREYHETPVREQPVRRCTETWETRQVRGIDGYDVTYRFQDRTFHKWMSEHPGDTVPVEVAVEPYPEAAP